MNYIKSKNNPLIKSVVKLKQKRYRFDQKKFLVEGFRFVIEALKSDFKVSCIFIDENEMERWKKFCVEDDVEDETSVYVVTTQIFKILSNCETPQGIAAVVEYRKKDLSYIDGFYILVDKVQNPGNMGTIIRSADASGAIGVIALKGTVDIYNEKTLRSTMGSIFHLPIIDDVSIDDVLKLKQKGFKLVVSSLDTENNFYDINLSGKVIIAVGNEGNGVCKELLDIADEKVKIPMPGNAESLNVSIAASIMMFEVVRQKNVDN